LLRKFQIRLGFVSCKQLRGQIEVGFERLVKRI